MSDTFLRMLGFDFTRVPADAERSFTLTNRAQSWEVFVLLGAIALAAYIVLWLYRREIDTCPRPVRYLLAGIRMLVILILIGVLLGPAIAITQKRTVQPYVVVLIDDTVSMAHQDSYTDPDAAAGVATLTGTPEESVKASKPDRMSVIRTLLKKDDRALVRGEQNELDRLLQSYAVEKARIEARKKGHTCTETQLTDGSIKLTIAVAGGVA